MDSLTQIVLGAACGEVVLGRKVGNKAILWGAIAGTIPDLDVLARSIFDPLRANELHRGITHSLFFSVAMAPLLAYWLKRHAASLLSVFALLVALTFVQSAESWVVRSLLLTITAGIIVLIFRRKRNEDNATTKQWGWLFFWSLVTHPLLDLHTTWGTQFLWPLPWKMSYNNIFVVDPLYTVPFMICVGAVMFMRRDSARRRWVNWLGIGISSAYMVFTIVCKRIAIGAIAASLERQHIAHTDFSTRPTPFNSILWTVNVDAGDHYLLGYHSLLDTKPEVEFVRVDKGLEALGPWADHEKVRRLQVLADHNFVVRLQGDTIVFSDLRFGQMGEPGPDKPFVFSYLLIPEALDTRPDETTTASAPPADFSALITKKNDPDDVSHALRVELIPPGPPNGEDIGTLMAELWERVKGE
ncbi:MAG: metal-dependent hydrolase [Flavobacteriales bacterium]|nr:metal-dependent hydrolase [Flavobacteriales bacterium]